MEEQWIWAIAILAMLGWVAIRGHIWEQEKARSGRRGPPSAPGRLPLVGHLHQLAASGLLLHRWLDAIGRRHGPIVAVEMGSPTLVVSSPDAARLALHAHDLAFASRPTSSASARRLSYGFRGLSHAPYGPRWRKVKEVYVSRVFNAKQVEHTKPIRVDEIRALVHSIWTDRGAAQDLRAKLKARTCNIITRMVMGKSLESGLEAVIGMRGPELFEALDESMHLVTTPDVSDFIFPALLRPLDLQGLGRRTEALFAKLDGAYRGIIDHRRRSRADGDTAADFLDALLDLVDDDTAAPNDPDPKAVRFTDDDIKAIFWDFFVGGVDTSSTTVEWGLAELVRDKASMQMLQEELDRVVGNGRLLAEEDIAGLPCLRAAVKEVLRLHPPVPLLVPHESTRRCEMAGFEVPEGTKLLVNVWAIGRDPGTWDAPSEFRPDRFLDSTVVIGQPSVKPMTATDRVISHPSAKQTTTTTTSSASIGRSLPDVCPNAKQTTTTKGGVIGRSSVKQATTTNGVIGQPSVKQATTTTNSVIGKPSVKPEIRPSSSDVRGHHFELLPFGSGRRGCPAASIGLLHVQLMLGALIHAFNWSPVPGSHELDMSETLGMMLHRRNPLVLVPSPRLPDHVYASLSINPKP